MVDLGLFAIAELRLRFWNGSVWVARDGEVEGRGLVWGGSTKGTDHYGRFEGLRGLEELGRDDVVRLSIC